MDTESIQAPTAFILSRVRLDDNSYVVQLSEADDNAIIELFRSYSLIEANLVYEQAQKSINKQYFECRVVVDYPHICTNHCTYYAVRSVFSPEENGHV